MSKPEDNSRFSHGYQRNLQRRTPCFCSVTNCITCCKFNYLLFTLHLTNDIFQHNRKLPKQSHKLTCPMPQLTNILGHEIVSLIQRLTCSTFRSPKHFFICILRDASFTWVSLDKKIYLEKYIMLGLNREKRYEVAEFSENLFCLSVFKSGWTFKCYVPNYCSMEQNDFN